jgi:hypothetical protein
LLHQQDYRTDDRWSQIFKYFWLGFILNRV